MIQLFLIAFGGFWGAISRFMITKKLQSSQIFPIGTLTVNLLGVFLLGILFGLQIKGNLYALFGVGFLGAFTTFSTFKLESEQLRRNNRKMYFYSNLAISYLFGLGIAFLGMKVGEWMY